MTVNELIELLYDMPVTAEVRREYDGWDIPVTGVEEVTALVEDQSYVLIT